MMCAMFIAIIGMAVYAGIDILGLAEVQPYASIVNIALGFILGITPAVKYRRILHRINFHLQDERMSCSEGYND